ncbi:Cro/CI family transcriptional regulator [Pseudomonas aeruginosa]
MNITEAIEHFGSKKKLADALGIQPSAVTQWGDSIPVGRQYQIQVISKNRLKAESGADRDEETLRECAGLDQTAATPVQTTSAEEGS